MTLAMTPAMTPADATVVLAHGIGGRQDLPLPLDFVIRGAAVAVVASFLALGLLWRAPRLRGAAGGIAFPIALRRVLDATALRVALRLLALAATGYVALAAIAGRDDALNPTPYVVYVLFWVGIIPASLLFGPVWRVLNPLRSLHWLVARAVGVSPERGLVPLPRWVGYWPAAVSLASFVWLELAAPANTSLHVLRVYFGAYAGVHLVAALVFGSRWFPAGDGFEVYSTMIGRLSPLGRRDDGRLVLRNPLDGTATFGPAPGVVALVAVLLGSTAFDSFSSAPVWIRWIQSLALPLVWPYTLGLGAGIAAVAASYAGATLLAGRLGRRGRAPVPGMLAHSMIPIVGGYLVAHYFSSLIFQGQRAFIYLSDPLGTGANWLGTADNGVDFSVVSPAAIALVQVVAVVGGHVLAVVAAHDRAVALFPRHQAIAGQLPLLVLMVGYTVGGLTLLFAG